MKSWYGRTTGRIVAAMALSVVTLTGSAVVGTTAASAATVVDLTCQGTNDATFSPGLTFQTQTVDIEAEGAYTSCVGDSELAPGTYTASGEGTMSCVAGGHAGTFTITWNTGEHSTIDFTNIVAVRPGGEVVVVATGEVLAGKFAGARYDGTFTLFHQEPVACLQPPGVGSASGPTALLFTSLL